MVRRRSVLGTVATGALLGGCIGGDGSKEGEEDGESNPLTDRDDIILVGGYYAPVVRHDAGETDPTAYVHFDRYSTFNLDGSLHRAAVTVSVHKLGDVDELWVTSPDCDLDVALGATADASVTFRDEALEECGDRPTLTVRGERDGVEGPIASYEHDLSSTDHEQLVVGNAGEPTWGSGAVNRPGDGTIRVSLQNLSGADEAWLESPDCSAREPIVEGEELTFDPVEDFADCRSDDDFRIAAADEDGKVIISTGTPNLLP